MYAYHITIIHCLLFINLYR